MKRRYRIVFTSDDHTSEVDHYLTDAELRTVMALAAVVNETAKWAVDIRMNVQSSSVAPQGDAA